MKLTRKPDRGSDDRAELDAFLDSQFAGTLSAVVDGFPHVIPILYARDGDRILLHGSTGGGAIRQAASGAPVAFCVFALDGIRVAHNGFHSGANYRSAVLTGTCELLQGDEAWAALDALTSSLIPGRASEVVAMTRKEVAQTATLALPIVEGSWLLKAKTGPVTVDDEAGETWMGYVPLPVVAGDPIPAVGQDPGIEVPASVRELVRRHRP
ncbi:MAG: pyridoxamine 5'-phosphate oxidase family protein [Propionibacteriaceae bacterium]|nr:pyridoxamine 5'-phosphate oxidase family protein [Micropruina sp.]HBX82616.1 pyridoxamine 5'-phosphate oxidase family protein [Propionibacteriaceae bacterium]HBY22930.1 pyridoxamine 5'-phosphate oxidase family protein [Propionibacteriaceae bacterium]